MIDSDSKWVQVEEMSTVFVLDIPLFGSMCAVRLYVECFLPSVSLHACLVWFLHTGVAGISVPVR